MSFTHLTIAKQTYFDHLQDALYYSFLSLKASCLFFIHGLFPDIFETAGSDQIQNIYMKILNKYKNIKNC